MRLPRYFLRWFCSHDFCWRYNVYGDEIDKLGGKRSVWTCRRCGAMRYGQWLHRMTEADLLRKANELGKRD